MQGKAEQPAGREVKLSCLINERLARRSVFLNVFGRNRNFKPFCGSPLNSKSAFQRSEQKYTNHGR